MMIIEAPCWNCGKSMLVAVIGDNAGGLDCGPEGFSEDEQVLAKRHGVLLKEIYSKTTEEGYLANICGHCGNFVGQWFLYGDFYISGLYGYLKYKRVS